MKSDDVRELHYVVKYNMETKVWDIDWDIMEHRFEEGNYYDSRSGWSSILDDVFENPVIKDLNNRLSKESV